MACVKTRSIQCPDGKQGSRSTYCDFSTCDSQLLRKSEYHWLSKADSSYLVEMLEDFIKLLQVQKLGRSRVAAILASNRVLKHTRESAHFDLATSLLGKHCLQALRSSSRDVRIAAG